jgi:beta-glucosidase
VVPDGTGRVNPAGLDFYDRLVEALLEAGIQPLATLYHWDLPQPLEDGGGWPARETADAFVAYADVVSDLLGDRVRWWITINEPRVAASLGYRTGEHAPGRTDLAASLGAAHHLLLAHGNAVPVIRRNSPGAEVGITLDLNVFVPGSSAPEDQAATALTDADENRWYLDPLAGRGYPEDVPVHPGVDRSFLREGDLDAIAVPLDFLGVNYYRREVVSVSSLVTVQQLPQTEMGWEIYPEGLSETLARLARDYPWPSYVVTENGAAFPDVPDAKGSVDDPDRIAYLRDHVGAAGRSIASGVPLRGYVVWSFLDNYEWAEGYRKRFGVVHVDFETQRRTPKASARWFSELARAGVVPDS